MKLIYPIATVLLIVVIIGSVAGGDKKSHGYFFTRIKEISPTHKEVPILFLIPYIMLFVVICLWITDKDTDTDTYNNN